MMAETLFDKIWKRHVVKELDNGQVLLYIDRQMVHEVTSPQAFEGLRMTGRHVRRPDLTFATMDHNVPTDNQSVILDPVAKAQMDALQKNCDDFAVQLFNLENEFLGIVHIIGPELGITLPGLTMVCGDSHTATHGAFGALAFGIGTSEVEHVLATQTLLQKKPRNFKVEYTGRLRPRVTSKDLILKLIGEIGTAGGTGCVLEYCGEAVRSLSMEARMTICNMSIEAGARAGMIAPDDVTFEYIAAKPRPYAPQGETFDKYVDFWKTLPSDEQAAFDRSITIDASSVAPQVTWGTSPGMVCSIEDSVPDVDAVPAYNKRDVEQALAYMGLKPGTRMTDIHIDKVFIGSCTNGRIEDLREAAACLKGRSLARDVQMLVVPGSRQVKEQAEAEGLDEIFKCAGAEWREAGCSMCLAMNPDKLREGERCAATSNRNFEGRQGKGGRTHLVSPAMAAAAGVEGHFVDIRKW